MEVNRLSLFKSLDFPSFDGNVKGYLRWKGDYKNIIELLVGKESFFLRSCLKGDPLEEVRYFSKSEEIFERLDEKYGDSNKLMILLETEIELYQTIQNDIRGKI